MGLEDGENNPIMMALKLHTIMKKVLSLSKVLAGFRVMGKKSLLK